MLTKENLEEILNIALSSGAEFAEIFLEENNVTHIICEDNKIEKVVSGTDVGTGIRVISGSTTNFASSTGQDLETLKKLAGELSASLRPGVKPQHAAAPLALTPTPPVFNQAIKRRPHEVSIDEKTDVVETLNKTARSYGDRIKQVTASYADVNQAVTIANSLGTYVEDNRIRTRFFVNVIAMKDNIIQTGYSAPGGSMGFELLEQYDPEKLARQATERALLMLNAPHAPSGIMPVVMSSEAGGTMVHEACGHSLEADFMVKGTSIFLDRLGKKVASDLITVIDDTTLPGRFGTLAFDDEGTPGQRTVLIENGILKGYMSDMYNARKLGMKSSGNGRRESFRHKPIPRMTNTIIAPGKSDPGEIISSIKNGILVKHMGGGEVNVVTGDFVFEVTEGYLIENGKVKHPVRGAIMTGNGPKVLEIIDMVGTDLGFQTGVCGKYDHAPVSDAQPTIRIPQIVIGGRA
ncbi:MAG: TldD/PmbA family protein [Candidatus Margulisbacteria bacterium]|nr:TldD/PmbA family protein [Candidatus Margulisiibacteriota bacterium]